MGVEYQPRRRGPKINFPDNQPLQKAFSQDAIALPNLIADLTAHTRRGSEPPVLQSVRAIPQLAALIKRPYAIAMV